MPICRIYQSHRNLGAHVAGFTGKQVKLGKIEAIVGIDPARPFIDVDDPSQTLTKTDANYVVTIHATIGRQGVIEPVGHTSFYPNWGRTLESCAIDIFGFCPHLRANLIYAAGVRGYSFAPIYQCSSFDEILQETGCNKEVDIQVGDPLIVKRLPGIFYFDIKDIVATKGSAGRNGTDIVKFYLFTRENPKDPQILSIYDLNSINISNYNPEHRTKIIIHGWRSSYERTPNPPVRNAYLATGDYNVISVDWSFYAHSVYTQAVKRVPEVGKIVADFVDLLNENFGLDFDQLVVIGHSLGAHIAGYCGKNVLRGKIGAIVGSDPALPLYFYPLNSTHLSRTDAKFVLTLQVTGGREGFLRPIGDMTFYPNWGRGLPFCGIDLLGGCSHNTANVVYSDSIRGKSYAPIYQCDNFEEIKEKIGCNKLVDVRLGDPLDIERVDGIYYFSTKDEYYLNVGKSSKLVLN
ncbi:lipase member H-like [Teleopsis dalmanni]|uniref:lipase member H-like n=1 Tax=Teleopsis dalmanni TaxID=139649 RepID=UPI0018CF9358|nr:lipase member H-like [Teleopsis dalmanni]XP_037932904.1 lipase member H-like [Teleopsis dalmanni]